MTRVFIALLGGLFALLLALGHELLRLAEPDTPSRSTGTTSRGRLMHPKRLPASGENFRIYSDLGGLLGRACVHSAVRDTTLRAYRDLETTHPRVRFLYGEGARCSGGGPIPPHRTHQNGMSLDFMVPVRRADGTPDELPAWFGNRYGYGAEFDRRGVLHAPSGALHVDMDALAAHLLALDHAARKHRLRIQRVILAPELRAHLFRTRAGREVKARVPFMKRRAWVRHDDHYHVDFALRR